MADPERKDSRLKNAQDQEIVAAVVLYSVNIPQDEEAIVSGLERASKVVGDLSQYYNSASRKLTPAWTQAIGKLQEKKFILVDQNGISVSKEGINPLTSQTKTLFNEGLRESFRAAAAEAVKIWSPQAPIQA